MDNTGVVDQGTGAATETSQGGSSSASEHVASESTQGQESNAGGEQSFSESGKAEGTDQRPRFKSKNETIYELRQKNRERESYWENEVGTMKEQLAQLNKMLGRGQERKPSRSFYEAPEDTIREIQDERLKSFKDELLNELRQNQNEREQSVSLRQEATEAAKFIRSQKGITEEDIQEIRELLQTDPVAMRLAESPMEQANYVMYRYEKSRGVTDKTDIKNKARSVQGSGGQMGTGGAKNWTEAEMEQEMKKLGDPKSWNPDQKKKFRELESEFMTAYRDGRVKK